MLYSGAVPGLTYLEYTAVQVLFPPTDRSGPDRLFRRGIAGPIGRLPQRQTRGLELAADHETGELLRDYADENSCLIF